MKRGIDISVNQGNINFDVLKDNIDFAILKASYGRESYQVADNFEHNYAECKRVGIPVGAYHYSYATSVDEARREAQVFIKYLAGKQFEYPVYYDVEEACTFRSGRTSEIIVAFCEELEKAGYFCGVYMSKSALLSYVNPDVRDRFAVWVAQYYNECTYSGQYGMWQYSSEGIVNGVNARNDMDYCYIDYPSIIKSQGLNGFPKENIPTPEVKSVESEHVDIVSVDPEPKISSIKRGDTGKKVVAIQVLLNCAVTGAYDEATENAVKDYQTKNNLEIDGICGKNTLTKLFS